MATKRRHSRKQRKTRKGKSKRGGMFSMFKSKPIDLTPLTDESETHFTVVSINGKNISVIRDQYAINDVYIFVIRDSKYDIGYLTQDNKGQFYLELQTRNYLKLNLNDIIYVPKYDGLIRLEDLMKSIKLKRGISGITVPNIEYAKPVPSENTPVNSKVNENVTTNKNQ